MKRNMKQWVTDYINAPAKKGMPILSFPGIQLIGHTVEELVRSGELQAQCMKAIADRFDTGVAFSLMDLSVEAEAFDAPVHYSEDKVPTVHGTLINDEDEAEAIEAIILKLEWETLGFEVIGSANNGVKALELVERLQPDVVITDIKMPYMDGLELARALNEDYQNIHIIIFTGFDEFEYAKEAVHLEIEEYMLKPINSQELSECLKRLKKTLDNEREEKLNVKKLEHYFNA